MGGVLAGLLYAYLASTWGGYVFACNLVGLHAAVLVLTGQFTKRVYIAFSFYLVVGTLGAMQVPVVGFAPLKSLEQAAPLLVFVVYQLLAAVCWLPLPSATAVYLSPRTREHVTALFLSCNGYVVLGVGGAVVAWLVPRLAWVQATYESLVDQGYVWDVGTRIKSLFVRHTKTGNPLVDSVAEHSETNPSVYHDYLHNTQVHDL